MISGKRKAGPTFGRDRQIELPFGFASLSLLIGMGFGSLQITSLPAEALTRYGIWSPSQRNAGSQGKISADQLQIVQRLRVTDLWSQVYEQLPDLPRENKYVSVETGQIDSENTLVGRLIRYHVYVKRRPPNFRFDWKLTLADYLGVNELMEESIYPGYDSLKENPIDGDRQAIETLTIAERNALVDLLVSLLGGNGQGRSPLSPETAAEKESQPLTPDLPSLPKPGDAELLKP